MPVIIVPVSIAPNITKIGTLYFTTYNTVVTSSGQLRVFPNTDDVVTIKAIDCSVSQAGYLELRKPLISDLSRYEAIKRVRWEAGDRVISIIDEEFEVKGDIEVFDVYLYLSVAGYYTINVTAENMKRNVWEAMKKKERETKGIDLRIG